LFIDISVILCEAIFVSQTCLLGVDLLPLLVEGFMQYNYGGT